MNENTFHGNVGKNPEINYGKTNGTAVVTFSIAINSRRFDRTKGEWVTRPTVWKDVVCFGEFAENVYDTIAKGMTVVVTGEEVDDSYTKESREPGGEDIVIRRHKIEARDIAVSLRAQRAKVTKVERNRGEQPSDQGQRSTSPQRVG
jgi:single-strand DNA-binding protein